MKLALLIAVVLLAVVVFGLRGRSRAPSRSTPSTDADVIEQLRRAGSDLTKPHDIEFFIYFPQEAAAKSVASQLSQSGYRTDVRPGAGTTHYLLLATKAMLPTEVELTRIRREFAALAASNGGEYDGWGTPIVR